MKPFEGVFGRLAPDPRMAEATLRRVVRRVQHAAERGMSPAHRDVAELLARLPEPDPEPEWGPDYRTPYHEFEPPYYNEVDRQRANLAQFADVRELVRGYRARHIEWDTDRWGPDPDDVSCLIPWDVLREAR
jgi:hypothetical protein